MEKKLFVLVIILLSLTLNLNAQYQNVQISQSGSNHNEVAITINIANPNYIAAGANISYLYLSSNGGLNWTQKNLTSSLFGVWGDPALLYDGLGNLYYGHLSNTSSPGYWIDRIVVQKSTDNGATFNQGVGIGFSSPKEQDKEWLAVDFQNNRHYVYTTWTEFDSYGSSNPNDSSRILFSRSLDKGATFSAPVKVSDRSGDCIDSDNTDEGAVPCVGINGEIFVSWSGPLGLMFDKSTDGGLTFGVDKFVDSHPGGWDIDVPGINRCNGLPITACDTSHTFSRGNIYICWGDQRNGTDNSDVWLAKSTDNGNTWSAPKKVNNDVSTRHQFFPWMTIDQTTGHLFFVFYDRRSTTGSATDVYVARSIDGGETFDNFKVNVNSFTPNQGTFFGDYTNIAAYNRKVYPVWMRGDGSTMTSWIALITDSTAITPVELNSFSAAVNNGKVELNWTTATETNNRGFEIERSLNNGTVEWLNAGFITGKGNAASMTAYSFTDVPSVKGTYKYRLKQIDFDGAFTYSNEIEVVYENVFSFELYQNYPNPFNPSTTIGYQLPASGHVTIKVYDVLGSEVKTLINQIMPSGVHEITFDASEMSSGIYLYRMSSGNTILSQKMICVK